MSEPKVEMTVETPPAETTEIEAPSVDGNGLQDISDMLSLGGEPPAVETKTETKEGTPPDETTQADVPDGGKEEQQAAPAPEPGEDAKPAADEELKTLLKEVVAEAKAPAPAPDETTPTPQPKYTPQLPDAIFNALESAEAQDRRDGMNALVGAMMNQVYTDVQVEMAAMSKQIMSTDVPEYLQTQNQQAEATKKMQDDFYGTYPTLGQTAEQRKLVAYVAMETAKKLGETDAYKGYTPAFRDQVAKAVSTMTGISLTAQAPAQPAVQPVKKPGQVSIASGSTTRPAEAGKPTMGQEIAATILLN